MMTMTEEQPAKTRARQELEETLDFIRTWLEHGELKKACDKYRVDYSHASKILRGKSRPKADFLKHLKDKAEQTYQKIKLNKHY
jgi:hypothetical protein